MTTLIIGLLFALVVVVVLFAIYRLLLADRGAIVVPPVVFEQEQSGHVIPDQLYRRMQSDRIAHINEFSARIRQ